MLVYDFVCNHQTTQDGEQFTWQRYAYFARRTSGHLREI